MQAVPLLAVVLLAAVAAGLMLEAHRTLVARRRLDDYLQWMLADIARPARR